MFCYDKDIALTAFDRSEEAEVAQAKFEVAREAVPISHPSHLPTLGPGLPPIGSPMLPEELEYRKVVFEAAFEILREAPFHPALGVRLLEQGHAEQAEIGYRKDLGASRKAGNDDETTMVKRGRDIALASADVPIAASCFRAATAVRCTPNGTGCPNMGGMRET
ncbi:TPR domain-containing protein [Colletotrichum graminicola M1.001]|uniref:TPR domain-containing protein n=1 Tax=Colletotrichum graminicola (strain M1.001 / M2 / FGSC 10212) TaxID=645133 RepID=E3QKE4_COLGM|nr:TPR domain-containing protein [Colletotrichum graminicola M1.001]EFQ31332.1 TPR domain-containing protein [Colletotrichum graminicola M1.001]